MRPDLVVMDWGIGGLSVHRELLRQTPRLSQLYFSDSGQMPYGKMSASQLRGRLRFLIRGFATRGIPNVVVACNAASTVLPSLRDEFRASGINVIGVIKPGIAQIRSARMRKVGVIGGRRTILSRCFQRPFKGSGTKVTGRIAQPLSALIEAGQVRGAVLESTLREILAPLSECDALLLACTHYPAVAMEIQKILPHTRLLDPARATAALVKSDWRLRPTRANARHAFMTSGDPAAMRTAARKAFAVKIGKIGVLSDEPKRR